MLGFLKRKPKASEDTEVFFACYNSDNRRHSTSCQMKEKTQSDKFRERYLGVDPFKKNGSTPVIQQQKQTKGKLNSTKKKPTNKTFRSLADLDVFN